MRVSTFMTMRLIGHNNFRKLRRRTMQQQQPVIMHTGPKSKNVTKWRKRDLVFQTGPNLTSMQGDQNVNLLDKMAQNVHFWAL